MVNNNNTFEGSSSRFSDRMSQELIKAEEINNTNIIAFYKLFSFADTIDKILMLFGTIGAAGNGLCQVIVTVLFGDLIDAFGLNQTSVLLQEVSKVLSLHQKKNI